MNVKMNGNWEVHAYRYNGVSPEDLGTLGGPRSYAYAINNNGQIVGTSKIAGSDTEHIFLYRVRFDSRLWLPERTKLVCVRHK